MNYLTTNFTILHFSAAEGCTLYATEKRILFPKPQAIEAAVVKISGGKIKEYFHTFIAIEGYDGGNIAFNPYEFGVNGVMGEHLIGAPSFESVAKSLKRFIGDSVIVLQKYGDEQDDKSAYNVFIDKAASVGIDILNPVIYLTDVIDALVFKNRILTENNASELSLLDIAARIKRDSKTTEDFLSTLGIDYDRERYFDRRDILTVALIDARVFTAVCERGEQPDGEYPF